MKKRVEKSDINEKRGNKIDVKALSDKLGCPVIKTVSIASCDTGIAKAVAEAAIKTGVARINK